MREATNQEEDILNRLFKAGFGEVWSLTNSTLPHESYRAAGVTSDDLRTLTRLAFDMEENNFALRFPRLIAVAHRDSFNGSTHLVVVRIWPTL